MPRRGIGSLRRQSHWDVTDYLQVRKRARPFYALPDLGTGHRGRVFRRLLDEAVRLVRRGRIPSVAEVAQSAGVSRATAYRYFPSRSKLVSAVIAEALGPVTRAVPQQGDAKQRLHELLDRTYSRFAEYEPHMRAALQLALEHQSLEAAGLLEEEPFRRGQRTEILSHHDSAAQREDEAPRVSAPAQGAGGRLRHRADDHPQGHLRRDRSRDRVGGALDDGRAGRRGVAGGT